MLIAKDKNCVQLLLPANLPSMFSGWFVGKIDLGNPWLSKIPLTCK